MPSLYKIIIMKITITILIIISMIIIIIIIIVIINMILIIAIRFGSLAVRSLWGEGPGLVQTTG